MNEFKILLIDDEEEQEEQLKEAIAEFNKKHFINKVKDACNITNKKLLAELSMLDNKEEIISG